MYKSLACIGIIFGSRRETATRSQKEKYTHTHTHRERERERERERKNARVIATQHVSDDNAHTKKNRKKRKNERS